MVRVYLLGTIFFFSLLLKAQQWSAGAYLTSAYGNIAEKSEVYEPLPTMGGGLILNKYKDRWLICTGVNWKLARGEQKIPVTSQAKPDGTGETIKTLLFMNIIDLPLGFHYAIINKPRFRLYGGMLIEIGLVLKKQITITNQEKDYKHHWTFENGYYLGVAPEIRMERNLAQRGLFFLGLGLTNQLHIMKVDQSTYGKYIAGGDEEFKVSNVFLNIGFGYWLKN